MLTNSKALSFPADELEVNPFGYLPIKSLLGQVMWCEFFDYHLSLVSTKQKRVLSFRFPPNNHSILDHFPMLSNFS